MYGPYYVQKRSTIGECKSVPPSILLSFVFSRLFSYETKKKVSVVGVVGERDDPNLNLGHRAR